MVIKTLDFLNMTSLGNRRESSKKLTRNLDHATVHKIGSKTLTAAGLGDYITVRKHMLRKGNKTKRLV